MKKQKGINRRNFLKGGATSLAGIALLPKIVEQKPQDRKFIYRTLGKTGIRLPIISMGVMNALNPKLVEAALEAGIVHIDTAWTYQRGYNETMIGKVIKERPRNSYIISTKVFESRDRTTGLFPESATSEQFLDKFFTSLKRLQLDYVDILYIHNISNPESLTFKPFLDAMMQMKKEGKARFLGVSTHQNEPEVIRKATDCGYYDVIQTAYNFRQKHHKEVTSAIHYAAGKGMGIVGMKSIAGFVQNIGGNHSQINAKAAIKWAAQNENVHTIIPGFTSFDQIETDLSIMENLSFTPEEKADLNIAHQSAGVYCQQCQQCIPQCPAGLDIPTLMRTYMYAFGYKNLQAAKETLALANIENLQCTDCHSCRVKCIEGFDVKTKALDAIKVREIPEQFLI